MSHVAMDADREVDLLIAGAGPAGMAAALVASLEGLDVLLCEKSDRVGGTGSTTAGTLWIPGTVRAAGFSDSGEQADLYLNAFIGEATNRELRPPSPQLRRILEMFGVFDKRISVGHPRNIIAGAQRARGSIRNADPLVPFRRQIDRHRRVMCEKITHDAFGIRHYVHHSVMPIHAWV